MLCDLLFDIFQLEMVRIQSRSDSFIRHWKQPTSAIVSMSFKENVTVAMSMSPTCTNHKHITLQNSENW